MSDTAIFTKTAAILALAGLLFAAHPAAGAARISKDSNAASKLLTSRAETAIGKKTYEKAIRLCEQAIVANPSNARAFACLARSHDKSGHGEIARKYYTTTLAIDPDNLDALHWSGMEALATGNAEAARQVLQHIDKVCGKCPARASLNNAIQAQVK